VANLDFSTCEKPDELLQLAWNAGVDRKVVIGIGSDAAALLLASEKTSLVTRFWPVPRPLEGVDRWAGNDSDQLAEGMRPFGSALVPGCVLGALVAHFLVAPFMSETAGLWALLVILVASIIGVGFVFKVLIERAVQRRAARLDETSAFAIVLEQVRQGMAASPKVVPIAIKLMRQKLAALATN
jgi:hypothetical protein